MNRNNDYGIETKKRRYFGMNHKKKMKKLIVRINLKKISLTFAHLIAEISVIFYKKIC